MQENNLSQGNGFSYIPKATTEAGACLTSANWSETGVEILAWDFDHLLIKPGLDLLKRINNFKQYYGWGSAVVFDLRNLIADKSGVYTLRSPYDGTKIQFSFRAIFDLISHLQPEFIISSYDFQKQLQTEGYNLPESIQCMTNEKAIFVTDKPAADGLSGVVYSGEGDLILRDELYEQDYSLIDECCECPCCRQGLTRAYLHHLFEQTPLLCYRFYIQHNAHYFLKSNALGKESL